MYEEGQALEHKYLSSDIFYKYVNSNITSEFYTIAVGHEKCDSLKTIQGPVVKNHFIIHYCLKGKGYYNINNQSHTINADDIFFIPPNAKISYIPERTDPWEYFWFEYNGAYANQLNSRALFSVEKPIFHCSDISISKLLSDMLDTLNGMTDDLISASYIYLFFSKVIDIRNPQKQYHVSNKELMIKKVLNYIVDNYQQSDLSLNSLSKFFHLNASYLSRVFKEISGVSLTRYLTDFRMQKACDLLMSRNDLNIKSIAYSVGYSDPLYFSKEFRRCFDTTPSRYVNSSQIQNLKTD
jgi:AraC-like DNA-binding protein